MIILYIHNCMEFVLEIIFQRLCTCELCHMPWMLGSMVDMNITNFVTVPWLCLGILDSTSSGTFKVDILTSNHWYFMYSDFYISICYQSGTVMLIHHVTDPSKRCCMNSMVFYFHCDIDSRALHFLLIFM